MQHKQNTLKMEGELILQTDSTSIRRAALALPCQVHSVARLPGRTGYTDDFMFGFKHLFDQHLSECSITISLAHSFVDQRAVIQFNVICFGNSSTNSKL